MIVLKYFVVPYNLTKSLTLIIFAISSLLFIRLYGVNIVRYHSPVPQCNQVLTIGDCKHYYAWYGNYELRLHNKTPQSINLKTGLEFTDYWLQHSLFQIFGEILPLKGLFYVSLTFFLAVALLGALGIVCIIANIASLWRHNRTLMIVNFISLAYLTALWARNLHDYLHIGHTVAISGRYWLPVLIFIYALMAVATQYSFRHQGKAKLLSSTILTGTVIAIFLIYGGFMQYRSQIIPIYGHISPSDQYSL